MNRPLPETRREAWRPQFAKLGKDRLRIGFRLSEFGGTASWAWWCHYGFVTELAARRMTLGVVAVTTKDSSNAVVNHIAHEALRLMLAAQAGRPLPQIAETRPVDPALARRLDGRYGEGAKAIDLSERNGRLYYLPVRGGEQIEVRQAGDALCSTANWGTE
jgi:hypothetical protein